MKTKIYSLFAVLTLSVTAWSQGVGINETGAAPDASAGLDVDFNNKGFLPPRMTTVQRDAISNPATGLLVYNTSLSCLEVNDGTPASPEWHCFVIAPTVPNICNPSNPTAIVDVTNIYTGKIWMDRNLGAKRAAKSSSDDKSYGSLYQWGRGSDGHECVHRFDFDGVTTSSTTALNATVSTNTPPHGNFIRTNTGNNDWRSPQNDDLWLGVNGTNNPCPSGYRLPTETELDNERLSWVQAPISSTDTKAGAFASPLKLPMAGDRNRSTGTPEDHGDLGNYWTSSVSGISARLLFFDSIGAAMYNNSRSSGASVRCLKD